MKHIDMIQRSLKLLSVGGFCMAALLYVLPTFSLATVESRKGEPRTKTASPVEEVPRFQGHSNLDSEPEPLISAAPNPSATTSVSRIGTGAGTSAGTPMNAEDRAARLTLREIESLQKEVGELRGMVEVQDHEIKQLKKSQQDFYMDLDRRLSQLQKTGSSAKTVAPTKPISSHPLSKPEGKSEVKSEAKPEAQKSNAKKEAATASVAVSTAAANFVVAATSGTVGVAPTGVMKPQNAVVATNSATVPETSETLYQQAYSFIKTKHYAEAVQSFQKYLNEFPKGEQVANAHYWLGEVYMVQWQGDKANPNLLQQAQNEFLNVANGFPNHTKTADATLKLGLIELEKGNMEAARQYLTKAKSNYPGTTAAKVAESRLQQLH